MSDTICPKLSSQSFFVIETEVYCFDTTKAGTQIFVRGHHVSVCKLMNGQTPLEILEKLLSRVFSAYQDLTHLLFLLWDRGLLENDEDIRKRISSTQARTNT